MRQEERSTSWLSRLNHRQVLFVDGMRYAIGMARISYHRLVFTLTEVSMDATAKK